MTQDDAPLNELHEAFEEESKLFREYYLWLEQNMPKRFFEEVPLANVMLITHSLMGLHLQDYFCQLRLTHAAVVLCLDTVDADVRVLERYRLFGIKHYRRYISRKPLPHGGPDARLRITTLYFTEAVETGRQALEPELIEQLQATFKERNPEFTDEGFDKLLDQMNSRFLRALPIDRLALALEMLYRAKTRDHCQYEVRYNDDWKELEKPSMEVIFAWRNTPKYDFLFRLAKLIYRHRLVMSRVNATYIDPYGRHSILVMAIGLNGQGEKAAWEVADVPDMLRELATLKYFGGFPELVHTFVDTALISGNLGNFLKTAVYFVHQILVHVDPHLYTLDSVTEGLMRHPELTVKICEAFEAKFSPDQHDPEKADEICTMLLQLIDRLDTGHAYMDKRRKNVLTQAVHFVQYTLKTNFFRRNKSGFSFRLDPRYLDKAPFQRHNLFPELPFAIFFIKGMHYIGFQIRFRDISRGGLRTVYPAGREEMLVELNNVFTECYSLAYTQQKKNKDIPEGGAKGIIFLKPYDRLAIESEILKKELTLGGFNEEEVEAKIKTFVREQKEEYLWQTQRSFVASLMTLINCYDDGTLKAKHIVDYYHRPEYIYLGPDERMQSEMILWIANFAEKYGYKPGHAFISSKPRTGINHKEYGVTSLGVNVYMHETLKHIGIDPTTESFTVKISGGPDGDVAGNQILNLYRDYPETAKLVALTDISGTINDPEGLDLETMVELFRAGSTISYYPPDKLSEGSFLLDRRTTRDESAYTHKTLCWRKKGGEVFQDWLDTSEVSRLFATNLHQAPADVFIPAGGRPRTLRADNVREFLDATGQPTSKIVVEGANLYLTSDARRALEELGTLVIKDSSANKCGVICSSFEVLCGLVLNDEELMKYKPDLVNEILQVLRDRALDEATLLLTTSEKSGEFLTDLSDQTSKQINTYTDQLLAYLVHEPLEEPLINAYLDYCLPFLVANYRERLLTQVPDSHKQAIIACHLASSLVYKRGLDWAPSIVDILPVILEEL